MPSQGLTVKPLSEGRNGVYKGEKLLWIQSSYNPRVIKPTDTPEQINKSLDASPMPLPPPPKTDSSSTASAQKPPAAAVLVTKSAARTSKAKKA